MSKGRQGQVVGGWDLGQEGAPPPISAFPPLREAIPPSRGVPPVSQLPKTGSSNKLSVPVAAVH